MLGSGVWELVNEKTVTVTVCCDDIPIGTACLRRPVERRADERYTPLRIYIESVASSAALRGLVICCVSGSIYPLHPPAPVS